MLKKIFFVNLIFFLLMAFSAVNVKQKKEMVKVKLGIDVLEESNGGILKGKRVGLITNISGVNSKLTPTIDVLMRIKTIKLVALFGPEHGVRGTAFAGQKIKDTVDEVTGLPVYSLYGKQKAPTKKMVENLDALVFDIQDIGSRSYTYISTMAACMKAAKKFNKMFVVLDRPNPLGGLYVDGNIPEKYGSFVCYYPIPYCHGMTIGELAEFFNNEFKINCDLHVIKMKGWKREMTWKDTGLCWIPTSPHIPEPDTPYFYAITGIIGELGLVNEGVGYTCPFKLMGAEWINAYKFAKTMNSYNLPGVKFIPFYYSPYYFRFAKKHLQGVKIYIIDPKVAQPLKVGFYLLYTLQKMYPDHINLSELYKKNPARFRMFELVLGSHQLLLDILANKHPEEIFKSWQKNLEKFKEKRAKYLLY